MKKEIFRKEALQQMSSPDQLDELMPVTSPRGWMALAGIGAFLALAVLWGFLGTVETSTQTSGALIREGGMQRFESPEDGEVIAVFVQVGQTVSIGDDLVQLSLGERGETERSVRLVADHAGRVLYASAAHGQKTNKGDLLIGVELPNHPMRAILYVSTKEGYLVQPGQTVQVTPATADRYSSKAYFGTVKSAGRFPESRATLFHTLQNPDWVNEFLPKGPLLEVVVQFPEKDEVDKLYYGTPCTAEIILSRKRPIELVFPVFGSKK